MNWNHLLSARRFSDKSPDISHDKNRSRFEQDYDRVIFSQPFRKLQDKTQVFPLPEDDFVHTRLTHSLEVSSVGRSLGKNAGLFVLEKYPKLKEQFSVHEFGSIVASACLAHDIGNPPFGHAGEDGISSFFNSDVGKVFESKVMKEEWKDLTTFEGNAQGFRILNSPLYRGTELTFATLGAFTKYPLSASAKKEKGRKSQKKFGYYQSGSTRFAEMAEAMQLQGVGDQVWCRHPLAFLVEAADDICYTVIDLEDGCRLGLISFEVYKDFLAKIIGDNFSEIKLEKVPSLNEKLGIMRAMAITQLVTECSTIFQDKEPGILKGDFDQALTDGIPSAKIFSQISKLSVEKIYRSRPVLEKEAGGYEVIAKLMEAFCMAVYHSRFETPQPRHESLYRLLPQGYQLELEKERLSVYESLQLVTDYISSLTDRYAVSLYKIVFGL
ncbi:MAG: deoxyguanosinetriphosphate triphosphohydrolase [Cytophagales bacterium]|nr:deoxyguanosinetriphosphate triphosphohydrolase [Cytophagales bacterium]